MNNLTDLDTSTLHLLKEEIEMTLRVKEKEMRPSTTMVNETITVNVAGTVAVVQGPKITEAAANSLPIPALAKALKRAGYTCEAICNILYDIMKDEIRERRTITQYREEIEADPVLKKVFEFLDDEVFSNLHLVSGKMSARPQGRVKVIAAFDRLDPDA